MDSGGFAANRERLGHLDRLEVTLEKGLRIKYTC